MLSFDSSEVLRDYRIAFRSRVASGLARREVLAGRAPFAIPGDGKEIAQVALAHEFRPGDWRCGYYRDQTLLLALGLIELDSYFANLYADPSVDREAGGGRQMANHYATRILDQDGRAHEMLTRVHASADISPVSAHLGKTLGLALASKLYRAQPPSASWTGEFSRGGDEVVFATIGNGGTSEGIFWETLNAVGVLQVPVLIAVWDDGMAISVPNALQTVKGSISAALEGFRFDGKTGLDIVSVRGDDYQQLRETFARASVRVRSDHVPALVHVTHMTQPFGHSSSGSHERYKSRERLEFEVSADPIQAMRRWIVESAHAREADLGRIEAEERELVEHECGKAFAEFQRPIVAEAECLRRQLEAVDVEHGTAFALNLAPRAPGEVVLRRDAIDAGRAALFATRGRRSAARAALGQQLDADVRSGRRLYGSHLYSESAQSPIRARAVPPTYGLDVTSVDARIVLRDCFDANLARDPSIVIFGEDVAVLGDVNLVFEGLLAKHGASRVIDTGLREATILGQGIGLAQRGWRPIVDIQYLDYMLYCLELASDELATLRHRTAGGQSAPLVIRTKGHRLQGMWHAGSPMAVLVHALRGMHVAVPRNMTQAAGMYNVLLRGDDPAIVIEVLNAYRLKEVAPDNPGDFQVPLGVCDVLRDGRDVTIVTYGACCRVVLDAAELLSGLGISAEVLDAQTLNPFDLDARCATSVRKTGALLVVDEDVPGGASAYLLQRILERDGAYDALEVPPRTLTGAEHRTPFGQDGDYFTKPGIHDVVDATYSLIAERDPRNYPPFIDN